MSENTLTTVELRQQSDYQFQIHFGPALPSLLGDEPPPLGQGAGPTPAQLLAAAVGNCLSDSLLFALRKFKQAPEPIQCRVQAEIGRSPDGHLRVLRMQATLQLGVPQSQLQHLDRVLDQFESFCTVTQSVRAAIPITVEVLDADGRRLK
ncbi:OsmC family protein [Curvibacter gracilis]|uniref:OsmC family protein n=1 Tax=Curvibacter gracilis TaxID=230310 RepID=UPI0004882812|nr:OsmC family protein [Curvibacter gracilis]